MNFMQFFVSEFRSISVLILIVSAIIHVIFAGAVTKDAARLRQNGFSVQLVSPMTWGIATLTGGVVVAAIYWAMHHICFPQR